MISGETITIRFSVTASNVHCVPLSRRTERLARKIRNGAYRTHRKLMNAVVRYARNASRLTKRLRDVHQPRRVA